MEPPVRFDNDLLKKIKWLMLFRVLFTLFLLVSTIIVQFRQHISLQNPQLLMLYGINAVVLILSAGYAVVLRHEAYRQSLAYLQIIVDTVIVSLVVFITGCYASIFSFLYLLVIVCSSILLSRKGSLLIAALSSIQYGLMLELEYYRILRPYVQTHLGMMGDDLTLVTYKIVITMIGCFAVAWLSSFLAEQARSSRQELRAMEFHVRRVEQLAYMGEMAAGLAHEIRNPLASLIGSIQILKDEYPLLPDQERLMRIVLREADRLGSLVGDFLLFAKPPTGNTAEIPLAEVIMEIVSIFENDADHTRKIPITTELIPDIRIVMDPAHFRQILWNLLLNAAEAMGDDGRIHIRMKGYNGHVDVQVMDTGQGISPENIPLIFNPFFTTKASGTGLGLSIVHRLLVSYDGRLDVESRIGEGTVMTLKLKKTADKGSKA